MKFNLNKTDKNKLEDLFLTFQKNIISGDLLTEYFYESPKQGDLNKQIEYVKEFLELDENEQFDIDLFTNHILPSLNYENVDSYLNNEYLNIVKMPKINYKGYELTYLTKKRNTFVPKNDISVDLTTFKETNNTCFLNKDYTYPIIKKDGVVWMSLDLCEINSMEPHITRAKGNVLTYGLGLGYYAFMTSNKKDVDSVTIVEKDAIIIDLFNKYILPFFPNKNKIKIVNEDALKFSELDLSNYGYIFIDIWHNAEDALPLYIKFKQLIKDNSKTGYWLETSIKQLIRRYIVSIIKENYFNEVTESDYQISENIYDDIYNNIYFSIKNKVFNCYSDVVHLLNKDYIETLLFKMFS